MQVPAKIRLKLVCRPLNFKYVQSFDRSIRISDLISAVESDLSCVTGRSTRIAQITTRDHYALLRHSEIMDVLVDEDVLTVYVVNEETHGDDLLPSYVPFTKKPVKKTVEPRKDASAGILGKKAADLQEGLQKKGTEERQGLGAGAAKGKEAKESSEQKPRKEAAKEKSKTDLLDKSKEDKKISGETPAVRGETQKEKVEAGDLKKDRLQDSQGARAAEEKARDSKEKQKKENGHHVDEAVVSKAGHERKALEKPEKKRKVAGGEQDGEKMIPLKKKTAPREDEEDSIFK